MLDPEFLTALSSLLAAIAVVTAFFFQWWDVRVNGELRSRRWVKMLFTVVLTMLWVALIGLIFLIDQAALETERFRLEVGERHRGSQQRQKSPAVPSRRKREEIGTYSVMPSVEGWTLPELAVLHRYRRRTT